MRKIKVYNRLEKQFVLACFRAGMGPRIVSERMKISYPEVQKWFTCYQNLDNDWAFVDDAAYTERQKAFELFQQGYGYKKVASELSVPVSRSKYWHLVYRHGQYDFFTKGSNRPKRYSDEKRREILNLFQSTSLSKKAFCHENGITVGTLNSWLAKENG